MKLKLTIMKLKIKTVILLLFSIISYSQTPFEITLEPLDITGLGGIQGYAFGQDDTGKWLIIGGRVDGLHRRQPFAAFDEAGNNNQLIVVDPINEQKWSAPLTSLPIAIKEQLSSTNMEFFQEGDYLYFLGGYGYSATENDHTTHAKLTAIKVSDVIQSVINNTSFTSYFRQITDTEFQVAGGRLKKINSNYYLLGGNKFIGRYNPQGPNNGPGFVQEYTDQIRIFTLTDDGTDIIINHLPSYTDSANLHRRDYNAEQQIMPNGQEGITMFSGVFQENVNLPFLNSVNIDVNGYTVNNSFQQYYNHYHCAVLPIYSETENEMHNVFFGGIAQFYDNNGTLVQDDDVPFVKTIARVTRDSNGVMTEYKLPIEMPILLGAGAEFIPNKNISHFNNEVFKLDDITDDNTLIGYIYGGISSTSPNIFFTNDGTQSSANSQIFKVYLTKNTASEDQFNKYSTNSLNVIVFPNPITNNLSLKYTINQNTYVEISIVDIKGSEIFKTTLKGQTFGTYTFSKSMNNIATGSYFVTIKTAYNKHTEEILFKNN